MLGFLAGSCGFGGAESGRGFRALTGGGAGAAPGSGVEAGTGDGSLIGPGLAVTDGSRFTAGVEPRDEPDLAGVCAGCGGDRSISSTLSGLTLSLMIFRGGCPPSLEL